MIAGTLSQGTGRRPEQARKGRKGQKTNGEKGVMRRGVVVRGCDVGVVGVQSSLSRDQNCNLTKRCGVSVAASCFCGAEWLKLS